MKKIECIIKPFMLEEVKNAITDFGVSGMTLSEVRGFGRQKGHTETYRGAEYQIDFIPKIKLELVVAEDQAPKLVEVIQQTAHTGSIGDGKIFVSTIEHSVRIRTGETADKAL